MDFTDMEFSRHPDARTERMDQIATMLCDTYPALREGLPPIIADKLEQLVPSEFRSNWRTVTDAGRSSNTHGCKVQQCQDSARNELSYVLENVSLLV